MNLHFGVESERKRRGTDKQKIFEKKREETKKKYLWKKKGRLLKKTKKVTLEGT